MGMELGMPPAEEWDRPTSGRRSKVTLAIYLTGVLLLMIWIMSILSREW
jgi:hypothetical protein